MRHVLMLSLIISSSFLTLAQAKQSNPFNHLNIANTHTLAATKHGSNVLDLADLIKNGMQLAVRDPDTGIVSYTHNGEFLKRNGYYYDMFNGRLQGFSLPTKLTADACTLVDVKAPDDELQPKPTTTINIDLNLHATEKVPSDPFDESKPNSYNYRSSMGIYDDTGATHSVNKFYVKNLANEWTVHIKIDGVYITRGFLRFNTGGELSLATDLDDIAFKPAGRQELQHLTLNFAGTTQYNDPSVLREVSADGYSRGNLVDEKVDANGYLSSRYSNGQYFAFSKIAVYPVQ